MPKNSMIKSVWKSIKEYQNDPEILKDKLNEFKEGVTDEFDSQNLTTLSRRKFLAVLAASTAYATTSCTDYRDKGEIIPYVNRPEEILPGKPNFYASTIEDEGHSYGILVKTREGRPIKIEGNPDDPINKGKIPSRLQAGILNLYDPERLKYPTKEKRKISWKNLNTEIMDQFNKIVSERKEIAIISGILTSPVTKKVIDDFTSIYSTTKLYSIQLANDNNRKIAWQKCFNQNFIPSIKWDKAKIILALESDFLGKEGNRIENSRLYSQARNIVENNELNRLYVVEAGMTLTGMNGDYRLKLKPQLQFDFLSSLLNELVLQKAVDPLKLNPSVLDYIKNRSLKNFAEINNLNFETLSLLINDLKLNKGNSIIYAGNSLNVETHILVNLINEVLDNTKNYNFDNAFVNNFELSNSYEIKELINKMNSGNVAAVIHLDSNPAYELPEDINYIEALSKVDLTISISEFPNETSSLCKYVLSSNNELESWGAFHTRNGVLSLQQPVISTLFDTLQKEEILLNWIEDSTDEENKYHKYLMNYFKQNIYDKGNYSADFNTFWYAALHDGILLIPKQNAEKLNVNQKEFSIPEINLNGFTVLLHSNYFIGNGKYANNGWLQELPHPVTKITWDNFACISPSTAKELNVEMNDLLIIKHNNKELSIPAVVQPGMTDKTLVIELGYGRKNSGTVADGVGFSVNGLLDSSTISNYVISNVSVSKGTGTYNLASTQEHHSLDDTFVKDTHLKRHIIQEGTLKQYLEDPEFLKEHKPEIFSITRTHEYPGNKWAMSIDLNKCLGCSECISSCNVENNVPVVGKDQVLKGREMQWIRIDRYYSGTPENPIVSAQPMLCQHCDSAPCENVCPVNATNHSPDGLNQMVYNRCVGTRYCANNCPYKVRRFNFFNFRDHFEDAYYDNDLTSLVNNPEVTVRSRGVMEKCTFCVQNIMAVRENAIREGREIRADEVKTSCQNACPTDAIQFGDSNNQNSKVTQLINHNLHYRVLEDLNIRPNVTYLAKIRNTHSEDI